MNVAVVENWIHHPWSKLYFRRDTRTKGYLRPGENRCCEQDSRQEILLFTSRCYICNQQAVETRPAVAGCDGCAEAGRILIGARCRGYKAVVNRRIALIPLPGDVTSCIADGNGQALLVIITIVDSILRATDLHIQGCSIDNRFYFVADGRIAVNRQPAAVADGTGVARLLRTQHLLIGTRHIFPRTKFGIPRGHETTLPLVHRYCRRWCRVCETHPLPVDIG